MTMKGDRRNAWVAAQGATFLVDQVEELLGSGTDISGRETQTPARAGHQSAGRLELWGEPSRPASRLELDPRI